MSIPRGFKRDGSSARSFIYKFISDVVLILLMKEKKHLIKNLSRKIKEARQKNDWDNINSTLTLKRQKWVARNLDSVKLKGNDLQKAYQFFLIEYLGIDPIEVPIVYEDEKSIIWRSYNWCPVLEVCKQENFDTREVCEKGWEKSVQIFLEAINPKLKFSRNYNKIRPFAPYCEEQIYLQE